MPKGRRSEPRNRIHAYERQLQQLENLEHELIEAHLNDELSAVEKRGWKRGGYDTKFADELADRKSSHQSFTPTVVQSAEG